MIDDCDTEALRRKLDAHIFREAEMRNRRFGRYEQANAWRMMCDALDSGQRAADYQFFDRGVFDLHGPADFDGMPFLVEEAVSQ